MGFELYLYNLMIVKCASEHRQIIYFNICGVYEVISAIIKLIIVY